MKKFAVIGYPLSHTLSPAMYQYLLDTLHIEGQYVALSIDGGELGSVANQIRSGELTGINVALPYKTAVIDFLDSLDEVARLAGPLIAPPTATASSSAPTLTSPVSSGRLPLRDMMWQANMLWCLAPAAPPGRPYLL